MPFTFSHASAIIPFHRRPYVLSALVTGSVSPDFLYYLPVIPNYEFTHSIAGLFLFCLPASLLILLIYHRLIKLPLIALLPRHYQEKLWQLTWNFRFFPLSQFGFICLSILTGAATHIVWDSFTHEGHADQFLPWLNTPIFNIGRRIISLEKFLQYLSSVFGLMAFGVWFIRLVQRQPGRPLPVAHARYIGIHPLVTLFSTSLAFGLGFGVQFYIYGTFRYFVKQTAVASIGTFFLLLIAYSCFWYFKPRVRG